MGGDSESFYTFEIHLRQHYYLPTVLIVMLLCLPLLFQELDHVAMVFKWQ